MSTLSQLSEAHARLSANMRGALWMLAAAVTFTIMTTLVKFLGHNYSPAVQTFYRQAAGFVVLVPLVLRNPKAALHTTRPGILLFRSLAGTLGMILAFWAYQEMPLAEANALSFTRTLWIVPLAIFVLRETVGPWRIGATIAGFGGVLLMLQPAVANSLGWPAIAALTSAALFAMTVTGVKFMTRDHSVMVLTTWSAILGFILALPMAFIEWRWPAPMDLLLLSVMGVCGLVTQIFYIKGMSIGDATAMAPIDYTRLLFAVAVGFFMFHETPDTVAMIGAVIVIGSTLVITLREARAKKVPPKLDAA